MKSYPAVNRTMSAIVTLAVIVLAAPSVNGGFIFQNLKSHNYNAAQGYRVTGEATRFGTVSRTETFTATSSAVLADVYVAVWNVEGSTQFHATLRDAGNNILETWNANAVPNAGTIQAVKLTSLLNPLMASGQQYSLTLSATGDAYQAWESGNAVAEYTGGFDIVGASPVPEPGSLAMWGLVGMIGVVIARRRNRLMVA